MNMMTALPRPYVATPPFLPKRSPERFRRMVALFERDEIEDAIEALIAYVDAKQGDPDLEHTAFEEWKPSQFIAPDDAEEDDPLEANGDELDGCRSEECFGRHVSADDAPGCPLADPGGCEHDGREPDYDAEVEQLVHDVPSIAVYANEPNAFTGEREFLGYTLARYRGRPGKLTGEVDCGRLRWSAPA